MSKGIIVFANNNEKVDYVKQAYHLAKRAKQYLNLPTTIITNSRSWLEKTYPDYNVVFDKIIDVVYSKSKQQDGTILDNSFLKTQKRFYDGTKEHQLPFNNELRTLAYDVSPYDETLVLDTDIVICNDLYLRCFEQQHNLLMYKEAEDMAGFRDYTEFDYVSDTGVDFYWATCIFFRKTEENRIFFDLVKHIHENWQHYNNIYNLRRSVYRNDHAFSIALHIINGHCSGDFAKPMPGKLYYTTDKDVLININNDELTFLIEKQNSYGAYIPLKTKKLTMHVLNKFSLNRELG